MVKLSNKGKSKPSKRVTLKTKFKIRRKVKQHNKKMRRQAKQMKSKGLKRKSNQMKEALPNMYPFKQQIMDEYKKKLPPKPEDPILELPAEEFGLSIQSRQSVYFPRSKDNNKKYITNWDKFLKSINICLFTLDARAPALSRDQKSEQLIRNAGVKLIYVLTKCDTVQKKLIEVYQQQLKQQGVDYVKFTSENKTKSSSINGLLHKLHSVQLKADITIKKFGFAGKGLTGKSTVAKAIARFMNVLNPNVESILEVMIQPGLRFIDTPYKIADNTQYPLFRTPDESEDSKIAKEQQILKQLITPGKATESFTCPILNKDAFIVHYQIQNFISVDDLLKKVGKTQRIFGKGGMVDTNKVRVKILYDWYSGKLNHLIKQ